MIAWDIARASAFVAFACYTLVVAWGIGLAAALEATGSATWIPPLPFLARTDHCCLYVVSLMLDRYARISAGSGRGGPRPA